MSQEIKLTAEEWHEMAAETLAKKNKELLEGFLNQIAQNETDHYERNLRDSFASSVLNAMICAYNAGDMPDCSTLCKNAYIFADKMLEIRKG